MLENPIYEQYKACLLYLIEHHSNEDRYLTNGAVVHARLTPEQWADLRAHDQKYIDRYTAELEDLEEMKLLGKTR